MTNYIGLTVQSFCNVAVKHTSKSDSKQKQTLTNIQVIQSTNIMRQTFILH